MIKTSSTCDVCRIESETTEFQMGTKIHDLCQDCLGKLEKVLQGTGRPIFTSIGINKYDPNNWLNKAKDAQEQMAGQIVTYPVPYAPLQGGYVTSTYGTLTAGSAESMMNLA